MDAVRLDQWSRTLVAGRSRRQLLRGFAGAALTGMFGLAGTPDVEAKRKKNDRAVCRKGERVDRLSVPANGESVRSALLAKGQRYLIRVSGFVRDEEWGLDADYYFLRDDPTNPAEIYDACFDSTDVGLSIDDAILDDDKFPSWGAYTDDHVYERTIVGDGKRLRLRLHDCRFEENTGSLSVEIFCR